jgi:hypothetical protein
VFKSKQKEVAAAPPLTSALVSLRPRARVSVIASPTTRKKTMKKGSGDLTSSYFSSSKPLSITKSSQVNTLPKAKSKPTASRTTPYMTKTTIRSTTATSLKFKQREMRG